MNDKSMNRRDFLRYGGVGAVKLGLSSYTSLAIISFHEQHSLRSQGIIRTKANDLTVHVTARNDTPRLLVNGHPARARMFFGGPASAPIHASSQAQKISFEFIATSNALGDGTMHFRFGQIPGDVFLDNIHVVDVNTGRGVLQSDFESGADSFSRNWTTWPPGALNTVGTVGVEQGVGESGSAGLHVTLKSPPNGIWPDWHIYHIPNLTVMEGHRYRVSLWVRAQPERDITVAFYRPGNIFTYLGGPEGPFDAEIKLAASVEVNFVSFPIPTPWPAPSEKAEWSAVDSICREILRTNPKALLIPRIGCDPPSWWREAHPDDVLTWEDGSKGNGAVVASPIYRREASQRLSELVAHLEENFGDHVAGYHPVGQNTGEWFYENTWGSLLNGYAPADITAWRLWLRAKYHEEKSLQKAWRSSTITFETASVPSPAERRASPYGTLRDPRFERRLIDFAEYQQEAMADMVCVLAHAVRKASQGRKLVLFFYGYLFEFGAVSLGPSTSGHYALQRVLNCSDVDIICSPISYFDRGIGGSAPAMTAAESVGLSGKMYLMEDDTRTYIATGSMADPLIESGATNLVETNEILSRNVAQEATRNFATWWMDLGMTGWFNDPRIWAEMEKLAGMDQFYLRHPSPFRPQVVAIIDERSMLATSASGHLVTLPGIYQVRASLARMGAPYGQYLLDDVIKGGVKARLYIFLNAWLLSSAQRTELLSHTKGATCIWCYAPGCYDDEGASPEAMKELTGFNLSPVTQIRALATPTTAGKRLGLKNPFGVNTPISPLFAATGADSEETLATYSDGKAAIALRRIRGGWSLFVGVPGLTQEVLRIMARKAKVHRFTQDDCIVYANGPILALHATKTGIVRLETFRPGAILDEITGANVGTGPHLEIPMQLGETRILKIE